MDIPLEVVKVTGFDDCIIGIMQRFACAPSLAYDRNKMIKKISKENNISIEDSREFFFSEIQNSYQGYSTPCFIVVGDVELGF